MAVSVWRRAQGAARQLLPSAGLDLGSGMRLWGRATAWGAVGGLPGGRCPHLGRRHQQDAEGTRPADILLQRARFRPRPPYMLLGPTPENGRMPRREGWPPCGAVHLCSLLCTPLPCPGAVRATGQRAGGHALGAADSD